ncbi:protein of unknown function [Candidatus Methylomirabilis oxygeniifera]|uniref:Uncharacterized protein n=1 Tax=Methylomirabilis oxygeniifera TaxID=671143 RepID=D5MHH1_METO1|nr:protein of unknown function [Candidatus Methylomirabilis oxyfera]
MYSLECWRSRTYFGDILFGVYRRHTYPPLLLRYAETGENRQGYKSQSQREQFLHGDTSLFVEGLESVAFRAIDGRRLHGPAGGLGVGDLYNLPNPGESVQVCTVEGDHLALSHDGKGVGRWICLCHLAGHQLLLPDKRKLALCRLLHWLLPGLPLLSSAQLREGHQDRKRRSESRPSLHGITSFLWSIETLNTQRPGSFTRSPRAA